MTQTENYKKAQTIFWSKVIIFVILFVAFIYGFFGINDDIPNQWKSHIFVILFTACLLTLVVETGMLILLIKAIGQKSFIKSRLWVILSFVFYLVHLIVFIVQASIFGWSNLEYVLIIGLLYEMVAINVMYDFMVEVRSRPPPLPSTPAPTTPLMVNLPMTTFKINENSDPSRCANLTPINCGFQGV